MRAIKRIIVHCSASEWGDAKVIDGWHKERGWKGIGYHFVILNGRRAPASAYKAGDDGKVEEGRPLEQAGAHVAGHNEDSIGICLIGDHHFTASQLFASLPRLVGDMKARFHLTNAQVFGHHHFDPYKGCPNLDVRDLFPRKDAPAGEVVIALDEFEASGLARWLERSVPEMHERMALDAVGSVTEKLRAALSAGRGPRWR